MSYIEHLFKQPAALPTIPAVVLDLYEMTKDPAAPITNIVNTIKLDQVLAAKVLRTANSAFFGRSGTVSRLEDAISTIGVHTLRTAIITNGLMKAVPEVPGIDMAAYWKMGLHTAAMASHLAARSGYDRDEAYTTGLMQGLGVLVIHLRLPNEAAVLAEKVNVLDFASRRDIEMAMYNFDNAQVGAELLRRWKFPKAISTALLSYTQTTPPPGMLGQLLSVSSTYAFCVVSNHDDSSLANRIDPSTMSSLNLAQDWLASSRNSVNDSVNLMIA